MHISLDEFISPSFDAITDKAAEHVIITISISQAISFFTFNGKIIIVHLLSYRCMCFHWPREISSTIRIEFTAVLCLHIAAHLQDCACFSNFPFSKSLTQGTSETTLTPLAESWSWSRNQDLLVSA